MRQVPSLILSNTTEKGWPEFLDNSVKCYLLARYSSILKRLSLPHFWHMVALDFLFQVKRLGVKHAGGSVKEMGKTVSNGKK